MEIFYAPVQARNLPDVEKVLVLAPHPDDEVFGCGGSLALYRQKKIPVCVHVLTDGAAYALAEDRQSIFQTRQSETRRALQGLDIADVTFSGFPDRSLACRPNLFDLVLGLIESQQIELIFAPSLWEVHPDHLATARAVVSAMEILCLRQQKLPSVLFYEVGAAQRPDLLVDITPVWPKKRGAMQCFSSQLAQQAYDRHITALNVYRTYSLPAEVQYAEAYTLVTSEQWCQNWQWTSPLIGLMGQGVASCLAIPDAYAESMQSQLVKQDQELAFALKCLGSKEHELQVLGIMNDDLKRSQNECLTELNRSRNEFVRLKNELERTIGDFESSKAQWQDQLQKIYESTSWRITEPLRRIAGFFKKSS